ncbi:MAG: SUF system Fe-S cluster assembly regulator [Proteobacteria bacterium]|nr:SUF system Fe-S cluster assembly regulator [Pseudomonadota bacterium]
MIRASIPEVSDSVFRLSKITDYGIVILAHLGREPEIVTHNAREVAGQVDLPVPVVSKVLKTLARKGLLESQRGAKGGYLLARRPEDLTVADMVAALEGPLAITECNVAPQLCQHEGHCAVKGPWKVINDVMKEALARVTLADLIDPSFPSEITPLQILGRLPRSETGPGVHHD